MSVSEKVAYLRGLMEGLDMDEDKKETKLFNAIIEALDDVASELSDMTVTARRGKRGDTHPSRRANKRHARKIR
ncbi:MAG: hypothetical protein J6A60_03840, partial [Clostridia bacterium]|nr:hypothetical protein [Clostridia bacterium]